MPWQDARTVNIGNATQRTKRKLGKRDQPPVEADVLLSELVSETVRTVARVLGVGGSVQFGSTRDRSAMLIRAWAGGDVYEDYVTTVAELMATLEALDDVAEGLMAQGPTPIKKPGVRGA